MTEPAQKPGRSRQDYGTPPEFLAAVRARFSLVEFDCDLAARADNAVCPSFISPEENALVQPWKRGDGWNWLNPPFADIAPWVERAVSQCREFGARTMVLIPAAVGSNWWRDWVHQKADVQFLNGRLTFVGCEDPYPKDCALLLYTPVELACGGYYDVWNWREQAIGVDGGCSDQPRTEQAKQIHKNERVDVQQPFAFAPVGASDEPERTTT